MLTRRLIFPLVAILIALGGLSTGCSAQATAGQSGGHDLAMASMGGMPADVQTAPATVREAYQFAAANADVMQQVPCYCGCGKMGHTSNYSCYVAGTGDDGKLIYDTHALGCSICVDITQDMMRLLRQGQTPKQIRAYVDQNYSRYGPSNMP